MTEPNDPRMPVEVTIAANSATLMAALVGALIKRTWPGVEAPVYSEATSVFAGEVLVRNSANGRTLSFFNLVPSAVVRERLAEPGASAVAMDAPLDDLECGLAALRGGPQFVSSQILAALVEDAQTDEIGLTPRERDVLSLVASGHSNREMAALLLISPHTVRSHLQSISARLGVSSRGKLAVRATELGLA